MTDGVTVRPIEHRETTRELLERVAALLDRAFEGWPRVALPEEISPIDHLEWKVSGPLPGFPALLVVEIDGELAGTRTVLARRILVRGEPKLSVHFVDGGVDPAFQGRGANRATQQYMHDVFDPQYDFTINDSTNPQMIRGRARLGDPHDFGNEVRPAVLPLDSTSLARSEGGRLPVSVAAWRLRLASALARLRNRQHRPPRDAGSEYAMSGVTEFDARFDSFCAEASSAFEFICERDAAFLNWRYADPRAGDFTVRVAERDGTLVGYVVTTETAEASHIVDILATPGVTSVVAALIEDAVRRGREAGSPSVSCWMAEHHPYRGVLGAAGFFSLGDTAVLYRPTSMPAEELAFLERPDASMHFTYGDTDFI